MSSRGKGRAGASSPAPASNAVSKTNGSSSNDICANGGLRDDEYQRFAAALALLEGWVNRHYQVVPVRSNIVVSCCCRGQWGDSPGIALLAIPYLSAPPSCLRSSWLGHGWRGSPSWDQHMAGAVTGLDPPCTFAPVIPRVGSSMRPHWCPHTLCLFSPF